MPLAICSCLCCWPISLIAIFNSRQVRVSYARGQYMHAYLASRRAKSLALLSVFMGTILLVWYYMMMREQMGVGSCKKSSSSRSSRSSASSVSISTSTSTSTNRSLSTV
ncbi:Hypothetical protein NocV09_02400780 [Nannochloropsis oceanica]